MKLDLQCIKDILLFVEKNVDNGYFFLDYDNFQKENYLNKYDWNTISYHIQQIKMSNLISNISEYDGGNSYALQMLSPEGHEFIANIQNDTVWKKVLNAMSKFAIQSIPIAQHLATKFALDLFT